MEINQKLFNDIYNNCLKIINTSTDSNLKKKKSKLDKSYDELCIKENHELQEFYSIVHEIRVYKYLSDLGVEICASDDIKAGPDFITNLGYIECTNATKGANGTPERSYLNKRLKGTMNRFEAALPRLSSSIWDKSKKFKEYLENNIINAEKPCIIALSTAIFSNEFHSDLNLTLLLQILYGIGCETMAFNRTTNQFVEETAETHSYQVESKKPPKNTSIPLNFFSNPEYEHIAGVILNNNSIGEELNKKYFCLLLNPHAKNPINIQLLSGIKYFTYDSLDEQYIYYKWFNA